jgi:hypothetical protein
MFGLFGRLRKRREEKKLELERIQEEKRQAKEKILNDAFDYFAKEREAHRQRQFQQDLEAMRISSLDVRREQMQGVLTAKRAYLNDANRNVYQSDSNMLAAQQFIQSVTETPSVSSDSSSCSHDHGSSSSSSDSSSCGGTD